MALDLYALARSLSFCSTHQLIHQGRQLHLLFLKTGILNSTLTIGNRLLQMYSRCGSISDACQLFEEMSQRNSFSWSTLIEGYMKLGNKEKSLELFNSMPQKNDYSWTVIISGFTKAGEIEVAQNLFNGMLRKNEVVWNSMIHAYARNGQPKKAVKLFKDLNSDPLEIMHRDTFILATVLGACTDLVAIDCGKQIHARILIDEVEIDSVLCSALINLYGKCGDLDSAVHLIDIMKEPDDFSISALISGFVNCGRMHDARKIFDSQRNPCSVIWNSIISGYISNSEELEAITLFNKMRRIGVQVAISNIASILSAGSSLGILEYVEQIHVHASKIGVTDDIIVASSLVDAYAKSGSHEDACKLFSELKDYDTILLNTMINVYSNCGRVDDAKRIFKIIPSKTLISWNSMLVSYSQNGYPVEAIDLFCQMNNLDLRTDKFSLASVISACASLSSLELGEQLFGRATIVGLESDPIIATSLVDLYCKCGFVDKGHKIFDRMMKFDEVSWNTMLIGYATNGYGTEALSLFDEMRHAGVRPSNISFTGILSACNHCGLVEEGQKWFHTMKSDYHIDPGIEHFSCMVDLFARAGCLEEAINLIQEMPFEADASMWSSVLRGCISHGNKILGEKAAKRIMVLEPGNPGAFVQLSNIFATSSDWQGSEQVRKLMRDKQVQKNPGWSWADC
ncbi:Pentatricopeptide repeat-containing protein [Quillaja saponaria]|uniref:Pentatricopeptide repeat-containing protein n=1 Tax=Quillaja saponaria TaxID=32244 RepID=A0AAD7LY17_QUISA|nr:Pentatricopeptide repeat-containing protein [Quillaja saponaria]